MKTIGLLGGMSWESTQTYYRLINEGVKARLGGLHSAKLVLYSVDFAEIEALQHRGDWAETARILSDAALSLQKAGADFLVIGTNTMHKVAPEIEQAVRLPLLHIADATAQVLEQDRVTHVGLLGTRFTMEQAFYRERLEAAGIEVLIPDQAQRDSVHRVIYEELCQGEINPDSRQAYLDIVASLSERGAQAVILGCTEIGLLIRQADTSVPLYDTTEIHAAQAVKQALSGQ
ncbi:aspartate/glutamate racemase family protein [Marinobacter panjinensis]|uniref:Aspartate/glutamate racemase family protein n=1 Tax=Marinobacter panjinensis TaxID=2576384 RepID=A0A4U6R1T5_9GAMM|nr:aspartate/glutamate racemase family protein [Marinobacter panjinensis]MCR8915479.1 aspartate/glutamate racemase family protein [Marinobacter panjinensis]TKV66732.1 aspartate/glutamate racemase family protein [Marinobacter panjinensis]